MAPKKSKKFQNFLDIFSKTTNNKKQVIMKGDIIMKEKLKNYLSIQGIYLAKEFNLDGYYAITDCVNNFIGVAVDKPSTARKLGPIDVWTSDQETYYWYIEI